ncbi:hypothetical protein [Solimonas sp. SE-A11]|uniref:hypothetical protein n=1 Tax=Solimonas sp. SE-A11 TaxID=3054954 RepID=UPI00259C912A|nr:hypothetical protein [Solimonas sp. SE-A11]MDM4772949.1 hypothetical protein [Solimonas sp. SE-A11]
MSAKRSPSGNGSNGTVPNGSKVPNSGQQAANDPRQGPTGRPAILDDEQLLELAAELNQRLGRPPRIEELIEAAGGCQKQRASRAIRALRERLAAAAVHSMLVLPPELEAEHRAWIDRWMRVAAERLSGEHALLVERHDDKVQKAQDLLEEQNLVIKGLRESLADQQRIAAELAQSVGKLEAMTSKLRGERDVALALAEDRLRYCRAPPAEQEGAL